jgi:hypothetical protein
MVPYRYTGWYHDLIPQFEAGDRPGPRSNHSHAGATGGTSITWIRGRLDAIAVGTLHTQ